MPHRLTGLTGLELSARFYRDAVRPILGRHFPHMIHSAALFGPGSEVLGYDDEMSRDHHWGPRVLLFHSPVDSPRRRMITRVLGEELPSSFLGFPTSFGAPDAEGVRLPAPADSGRPVAHMVELHTVGGWFRSHLGFDVRGTILPAQWLRASQQQLLEATAGQVFHDGLHQLRVMRRRLAYYPRVVWLGLLAEHWHELGNEQPLIGRTALRRDDVGSRIIAARQVQRIMELCFMMERRYIPYSKWLGVAFLRLRSSRRLLPHFQDALAAADWRKREQAVCRAAELAIRIHNRLKLTAPVPPESHQFYGRPFRTVQAQEVAIRLRQCLGDARRK